MSYSDREEILYRTINFAINEGWNIEKENESIYKLIPPPNFEYKISNYELYPYENYVLNVPDSYFYVYK